MHCISSIFQCFNGDFNKEVNAVALQRQTDALKQQVFNISHDMFFSSYEVRHQNTHCGSISQKRCPPPVLKVWRSKRLRSLRNLVLCNDHQTSCFFFCFFYLHSVRLLSLCEGKEQREGEGGKSCARTCFPLRLWTTSGSQLFFFCVGKPRWQLLFQEAHIRTTIKLTGSLAHVTHEHRHKHSGTDGK